MRILPLNNRERIEVSWAKVIESYEMVPDIYKEFFRSHLPKGQPFPYTILTPSYETFGGRITEKMVCAIGHTLFVLEGKGSHATKTCYPIDEINSVEVSSLLLDFRLKINGITSLGVQTTSSFRSSTVTDYVFAPLLKRIRLRSESVKDDGPCRDLEMFERWSERYFKFMNLARHCILAGETVVHAVLQPEIRTGKIFHKMIAPTHVCILTDKELILIREEHLQGRKDRYGGIWDFIPLNKIESISLSHEEENLLALSIQLRNGERFERLFEDSLEKELNHFVAQTHNAMPRESRYVRD